MTLKEYLEARNLTLRQFSMEVNIDQSQLSRYSTGLQFPSLVNAKKIHDRTKGSVSLIDWFEKEEKKYGNS